MSFLEQAFELAVVFSAVDNLTGPVTRMATQLGVLDAQTKAVQERLNNFRNMTFIGGAMTMAGAVMAKGLLSASNAAGELQMSLTGVREALKLNNGEFRTAMNLAQTVGVPTGFTAQDVGNIMQTMATSGLNKQQVMDPSILKEYVNFADIQSAIKKENASDVVGSAVKMAHQYQLYSSNQISPFLNELNGALLHTNGTADEFGTTFKYISNQARTMGMSAEDTLATTAWLDRMGLGSGRGGTNFADFLQRSIYHSSGKKADEAMVTAGFVKNGHSVFEDAQGQFVGIPETVKIMQDFNKRFGNNSNITSPLLKDIFGTQGARVAMMMTSSGASDQYTNVQQQITGSPPINEAQKKLNEQWARQMKQLGSDLNDIWTNFGLGVQASLLPFVTTLNDILADILKWTQMHPEIMKWVATFTEIAAAVLLVVGPITLLAGVLGYLKEAKIVGAGFDLMKTAIGGAAGPVLGLMAAGYLLYQAWTHDWGGIKEKTKAVTDWIRQEIPKAEKNVKDFLKDLGLIDNNGQFHVPQWLKDTLILVATLKVNFDLLKLAALAFNAVSDTNPWVLAIGAISLAVITLVTHWDEVKAAIDAAKTALDNFLGTNQPAQEKQVTKAYSNFYNNPNYKPSNPNGTITQAPSSSFWSTIGNGIGNFRNWVQGRAYATGTDYAPGGWSLVGENGPELVNLPRGSQVIPNNRLGGGNVTIIIKTQPNHNEEQIANLVIRKLGYTSRTNNMSRSIGANRLIFG